MGRLNDLTGRRFGKLLVLRRYGVDDNKKILWECLCDCRTTRARRGNDLLNGKLSSCGCSGRGRLNDLTGRRFGKLLVVGRFGVDANKKVLWECVCDCGITKPERGNDLTGGKLASCGCEQYGVGEHANAYKHGRSGSRLRWIWTAMRRRCNNPTDMNYPDYGGRGIRVCEAWEKFENFFSDMGERPHGSSLNRVDNDANYCKENCEWASAREQGANRRNTKNVLIDGDIKNIPNWSRVSGISERTIRQRLKAGWEPKDAVFQPIVVREEQSVAPNCVSSSPIYRTWVSMRSRCRSQSDPNYKDYGGRGIKVHPSWESYANFLAYMGERPAGMSLERIDVNKDYAPGNCRWASHTDQIRNRRTTRKLTIDGVTRSFAEWSEISGVKLEVIVNRFKRGWIPRKAVFESIESSNNVGNST